MFNKPYLIQRCTVRGGFKKTQKVSEYLSLDYMGSAEFEFGSIPKSLRDIESRLSELSIWRLEIKGGGMTHIVHVLSLPDQLPIYEQFFKECASALTEYGGPRLKERISLSYLLGGFKTPNYWSDDFWLDIVNGVAICQERGPLENFIKAVSNSVEYMNEQKKLNAGG